MYSSAFDDVAKIHRIKSSPGKVENLSFLRFWSWFYKTVMYYKLISSA